MTKVQGAIRKKDVTIAKNYLSEDEITLLGLLVEQYLAFAETMAQQHTPMYMKDWIERLDVILKLNGRELLSPRRKDQPHPGPGKINSELSANAALVLLGVAKSLDRQGGEAC